MKMLIADGKVISVSRGVRGSRGTRTGPKGTREMFTVVVSTGTPTAEGSNPDGHLFGEREDFALDEESEDEDENEALVSLPACLPAAHGPCTHLTSPASTLVCAGRENKEKGNEHSSGPEGNHTSTPNTSNT